MEQDLSTGGHAVDRVIARHPTRKFATMLRRGGVRGGLLLGLIAGLLGPLLGGGLRAQTTCYHFGSTPMPATVTSAPVALGCTGAPSWPMWHLFTPAHRAPIAHLGFNPGNATARRRILVAYRCTGLLFAPVVPTTVTFMGYVTDQPEHPCATAD